MGRADYLKVGDHNARCFRCGEKRKASELKKEWEGYWVCPKCWNPRQPQDFVRSVPDVMQAPYVQAPEDRFVYYCTPLTVTGIAGYGGAGCMIPEYIAPGFPYLTNYYQEG